VRRLLTSFIVKGCFLRHWIQYISIIVKQDSIHLSLNAPETIIPLQIP
jgi:hypothetical protein